MVEFVLGLFLGYLSTKFWYKEDIKLARSKTEVLKAREKAKTFLDED